MELEWEVQEFDIEGLKLVTPFRRDDTRGFFLKTYEKEILGTLGIIGTVDEIFETFSGESVVRGLHFQTREPQAKLVRAVEGEIYDVAVDLRDGSPTFGRYQAVRLDSKLHKSFYIPEGFAHGFQVLGKNALVSYACFGRYLSSCDNGIYYADETLGIEWPKAEAIVSEKDRNLMSFEKFVEQYGALEAKES